MKLLFCLMTLSCALFESRGHPVFTSSGNVDTWSYGDANRGGMVLSRFHDPYFNRRAVRGGQTTYALREPRIENFQHQFSQFQQADRRRQALLEVNDTPPQENEVNYIGTSEGPAIIPIEVNEFIQPLEQPEAVPTTKAIAIPELVPEPKIEEEQEVSVPESKKAVNKNKPAKPVYDEDDDDDDEEDEIYPRYPKFPAGAFFPMFFGSSSGLGGATAVANAFSNGRGGAATSEAVAYGVPEIIKKA